MDIAAHATGKNGVEQLVSSPSLVGYIGGASLGVRDIHASADPVDCNQTYIHAIASRIQQLSDELKMVPTNRSQNDNLVSAIIIQSYVRGIKAKQVFYDSTSKGKARSKATKTEPKPK